MIAQVPFQTRLNDLGREGLLARVWIQWLNALRDALNTAALAIGQVELTAQGAAIAATAITTPALAAGLYRLSYYARITQAATVNSSLTPRLNWTDGGVAQSFTAAAITGNTTATTQSDSTLVHLDAGTAVTYQTAYASAGATPMQYALYVTVESV